MSLNESICLELERLERTKTFKTETIIESEQGAVVRVAGKDVIMLGSNNYLGLASHPRIKEAAIRGIREYGYGVSSVRFLCGTLTVHRQLEEKIAGFLGTEDSILYSSCFAANEGFFASIVNEKLGSELYRDVIYSDRLNHASIIDGTRLCRVEVVHRKVYEHADVNDLRRMLEEDRRFSYRFGFIATDGVFSMEGDLAPLPALIEAAAASGHLLFVDDSHAVGVAGRTGRGTPEQLGVHGKVDVLSGTLGKAKYFRKHIRQLGFRILEGDHPIVPIMLGEASMAMEMSNSLLDEGVYIKGLWYPVVPKGEARLRAQISAALDQAAMDRALSAFEKVGRRMGAI